jgi:hypothetical protein
VQFEVLQKHRPPVINPATRQWLCYVAALDRQRPMPDVEPDWEILFDSLCYHGLVSIAHFMLNSDLPTEFRQKVAEEHQVNVFSSSLMRRRVAALLSALNATQIDYMVVKGPVLAFTMYPDSLLRHYRDLDIIIRERDWGQIHQHLLDMGFLPQGAEPPSPPKLIPQEVIYESKYRHPDTRILLEVHFDDILNAGIRSHDAEGFWQRAVLRDIDGQPARIMALSDQLLHLCAHAHHHAYIEIKWLTDIALIVRDHSADLNWEQLIQAMCTEQAQVSVYYSLVLMGQMLDVHAPDWVLASARPDAFRRFWHEHYLPMAQVSAMKPIEAPYFSFYFLPLLDRLLPDLLVMGRRTIKFYYLLRLLCPPPDWLRSYYQLNPTEHLLIHYLLHPAKLAVHYITEIVNRIFRRQP